MKLYEGCGNRFLIDEEMISIEKISENNCDGFLYYHSKTNEIEVYNKDGSYALCCINGLRCVYHYLYDQGKVEKEMNLKIGQQSFLLTLVSKKPFICTVTCKLPMIYKNFVDIGNSHFICLGQNEKEAEDLSKRYDCNVSFIEVKNTNQISCRTYERGVGFTKSCGSGACASAFYCMENKLCYEIVEVIQDGGILVVEKKNHQMKVTGRSDFINEL